MVVTVDLSPGLIEEFWFHDGIEEPNIDRGCNCTRSLDVLQLMEGFFPASFAGRGKED
ncbi:hypothetical protein DPMN_067926 [Dreissena polymorpha]|uniref:Uncharacterized protein n=1 Tax=Dreissena polymorpha TaxID=45954 RepID=A0A9D3YYT2_DREPO|nr:hypothetical protein DPMN_067926 [Dreissena polymorpha]